MKILCNQNIYSVPLVKDVRGGAETNLTHLVYTKIPSTVELDYPFNCIFVTLIEFMPELNTNKIMVNISYELDEKDPYSYLLVFTYEFKSSDDDNTINKTGSSIDPTNLISMKHLTPSNAANIIVKDIIKMIRINQHEIHDEMMYNMKKWKH